MPSRHDQLRLLRAPIASREYKVKPTFLLAAIAALCVAIPPTLLAPAANAAPKNAACMMGVTQGNAPGQQFVFPVPDDAIAAMTTRGFVEQACVGKQNSVPKYRKEMCRFASQAPGEILQEYANVFGIAPDELCSLASSILGN